MSLVSSTDNSINNCLMRFAVIVYIWILCLMLLLASRGSLWLPVHTVYESITAFCQYHGAEGFVAQTYALLMMGVMVSFLGIVGIIIEKSFRLRIWSAILISGTIYFTITISLLFLLNPLYKLLPYASFIAGFLFGMVFIPPIILSLSYFFPIASNLQSFLSDVKCKTFYYLFVNVLTLTLWFMIPWIITALLCYICLC
jgi:hypothetical protein